MKVPEDDLRFAIQSLHDSMLATEYDKRQKLTIKMIELQQENHRLTQKYLTARESATSIDMNARAALT